METTEILVVGKHAAIMKVILRLINAKPGWNAMSAFSGDEAVSLSAAQPFKLVLLGAGLTEQESSLVKSNFKIPVIQHYGGGSGLLYAEIYGGLASL